MSTEFISGSLVIALASICCGGLTAVMACIYRLKCSTVNFCGIICSRDVLAENESYQLELRHPIAPIDVIPPSAPNSRRNST
jgi:hypothetical protein